MVTSSFLDGKKSLFLQETRPSIIYNKDKQYLLNLSLSNSTIFLFTKVFVERRNYAVLTTKIRNDETTKHKTTNHNE